MENKTKIYCVEINSFSSFSLGGILNKIFISREDAEYAVWKMKMEDSKKYQETGFVLYHTRNFQILEIEFSTIEKGKDYKDFLKSKTDSILKDIRKCEECSETDSKTVEKLKKELEFYSSK